MLISIFRKTAKLLQWTGKKNPRRQTGMDEYKGRNSTKIRNLLVQHNYSKNGGWANFKVCISIEYCMCQRTELLDLLTYQIDKRLELKILKYIHSAELGTEFNCANCVNLIKSTWNLNWKGKEIVKVNQW